MLAMFNSVLQEGALTSFFQPIVDLQNGRIIGYEGLIRGPSDTPLHSPDALFNAARLHGRTAELETLCHRKHMDSFARLQLAGKLFLNMSSEVMTRGDVSIPSFAYGSESRLRASTGVQAGPSLSETAGSCGGRPGAAGCQTGSSRVGGTRHDDRIVIEITEFVGTASYASLLDVVLRYRSSGLQLAIDDLGEGFSSLRLWSELRPEYVKVDKYFVHRIDSDPMKRQFVRAMAEIAFQAGSIIIAEGIETEAELAVVRTLGIPCGQGYLLGRPTANPAHELAPGIGHMLAGPRQTTVGYGGRPGMATARKILREVPTVDDSQSTNEVYGIFQDQPQLQVLAVLRDGAPVGLIHRTRMLDRLARPYQRELYGAKPCDRFIENAPLVVDQQTSLQDLAHLFTEKNPHHLFEGFIITAQGRFIGVGTGFDLLREITQMQMDAARYANPLTQLPGNVPINEHIDRLLESGESFAVCYADLDQFKPFNDLYGYRNGDEAIQLTAELLRAHIDPAEDFLGHIGGDDFILVFRSDDWKLRCRAIVDEFPASTRRLYRPEHLTAGGYVAANRQGQDVFHQLLSISLGIVRVDAAMRSSSVQIAEMAALAKSQAKKVSGNAMFVERRALPAPFCP